MTRAAIMRKVRALRIGEAFAAVVRNPTSWEKSDGAYRVAITREADCDGDKSFDVVLERHDGCRWESLEIKSERWHYGVWPAAEAHEIPAILSFLFLVIDTEEPRG
jgi:hypothetical protein